AHVTGSPQHTHFGSSGEPPIAMTGPCSTGKGGVFLSLWSMRSNERGTFFPSNCTSKEEFTNSALPLVFAEIIPPPAVPAPSPVEVEKFESFTQTGLPSMVTCFVPWAMSLDMAMFG